MKVSFVIPLVFVLGFGTAHGRFASKGRDDLKLRMDPMWMDLPVMKRGVNELFGSAEPPIQATGTGRPRPFGHKSRFHHKTHPLGSATQSATSTPTAIFTTVSTPDPSQSSTTLSSSNAEFISAKPAATGSAEVISSASPPSHISSPTSIIDIFKADYLDPQNALRVTKGAVPLVWNSTLATYAQVWANNCEWMHSGGSNGENLSAGTGSFNATDAVTLWTDEESTYNPSSPTASHYTQVVWKGSTQLGCAVATCNNLIGANTGNWQYHVCEYYPHGNVIGEFSSNVEA